MLHASYFSTEYIVFKYRVNLLKLFYIDMINITLISSNHEALDEFVREIRRIALKMGLQYSGPTKLSTKEVIIPYKKRLYRTTWDIIRMKLYRCMFGVNGDERFMRRLSILGIPDNVFMSIKVE